MNIVKYKNSKQLKKLAEYQPTMTWAPSHVELGLLNELLRYANIIDGLNIQQKRELRRKLEIMVEQEKDYSMHEQYIDDFMKEIPDRSFILGYKAINKKREYFFCGEICLEYIDYLKNVLKPYLKS